MDQQARFDADAAEPPPYCLDSSPSDVMASIPSRHVILPSRGRIWLSPAVGARGDEGPQGGRIPNRSPQNTTTPRREVEVVGYWVMILILDKGLNRMNSFTLTPRRLPSFHHRPLFRHPRLGFLGFEIHVS